jgi:dihydroxy-acid dehydratase
MCWPVCADGVSKAGAKPVIFNTITVSDAISMGTEGMKYSLVSREVIADSIETVMGAEGFDGLVAIGGCDKNMPACVIAMARLNCPAVFVYGGTILPVSSGQVRGHHPAFEAVGQHAAGKLSDAALADSHTRFRVGSCGEYTANTMVLAIEALGLSLPNSSAQAAVSDDKKRDCVSAGAAVANLIEKNIRPRDILTKKAFENAIVTISALGGSTNAVLHLLAIAHAAGVKLSMADFTRIGKRAPVVADLKPSGKYVMAELVKIGGLTPLMKRLLDRGLLHGDTMTVTGKTLAENLRDVKDYPADQIIKS